jgi:hypothetical protein
MSHPVTLAATHHDADGRLMAQAERMLPALRELFAAIAVRVTDATTPPALALLADAGALVRREPSTGHLKLGRSRRSAIALGLELPHATILFCDFDRALHWAEFHLDELRAVVATIAAHDCTVLGRTPRAFNSHPRVQCDTEAIVNTVYAQVSGMAWDVTAAARGLSRRAVEAILRDCPEEGIGTDVAWPLFLQRAGGFDMHYIATEGLEFETPDRFPAEVAAAGGVDAWIAQIDADPYEWAQRLAIARAEVEASYPYLPHHPYP